LARGGRKPRANSTQSLLVRRESSSAVVGTAHPFGGWGYTRRSRRSSTRPGPPVPRGPLT
jgi:hypothetical protein